MFEEIAIKYNLDRHVLEALAYQESQMNYLAVGQASDMGLMQVVPATWNEWAPKVNVYDPFDPYSNIMVGAAYLAHIRDFCLARGRSEPHWMLLGYNWGPYRLGQFIEQGGTWEQIPVEQRQYVATILKMATARALSSTSFEDFYKAPSIR
jgi:soluble lytic murein transglycosylase-like protein